jgi:acyl carrier protein
VDIRDDLLQLINDEISLNPAIAVEGDTDLLVTGLVDSLGIVEVVAWMEERIGAAIDPIDIVRANFQTVDRMVAFAGRLQSG